VEGVSLSGALLNNFSYSQERLDAFIRWEFFSPTSGNILKRLLVKHGQHRPAELEHGFCLEFLREIETTDLLDMPNVGAKRRDLVFRELSSLETEGGERGKSLSLRAAAGLTGTQFDRAFIRWDWLDDSSIQTLQHCFEMLGVDVERNLVGDFRIECLDAVSVLACESTREVGSARCMRLIASLSAMNAHIIFDCQGESEGRCEAPNAILDSTCIRLDRLTVALYGGSSQFSAGLENRLIVDSHMVVRYLTEVVAGGTEQERAGHRELMNFTVDLARRARNFELTDFGLLFGNAINNPSENYQAEICQRIGFTIDELNGIFPQFARAAFTVRARARGESLQEIGNQLGVTRERARQLIISTIAYLDDDDASKVKHVKRILRESSELTKRLLLLERQASVAALICESPGISISALSRLLEVDDEEMKLLVPHSVKKFVSARDGRSRGQHRGIGRSSEESILKSLQLAGTFHYPLSAPQYDELVILGEIQGSSSQTIAKRFGTWKSACLAAGVEPTNMGRQDYDHKWSWEEIVDYVVEYLLDVDTTGTFADYDEWRMHQISQAPSGVHVRNQMDTWTDALEFALIKISELGPLNLDSYWPAQRTDGLRHE
jgi:hypothetical protein